MANSKIKGITIQLDGDTTKLTEALKKVNKEIRDTQSDLKEIDKLLKLDPGNTDLLAQKQKALGDAVDQTKEKLKQEQDALKQLQDGPQNKDTIKQQEALTREIESTKQSLKGLESQYKSFGSVSVQSQESSIKKLNSQLKTTKENLKSVNEALKLDPGNTDLLAQKQKLLGDAVEQTKQKLAAQKEELEALKSAPQTDEVIQKQEQLTREIEGTEASLKDLEGQYRSFGSVSLQAQEASIQKLNEQLKTTKENLKSVNDALKLDPGNTDLLTQKQKLLGDAVEQTKQKLAEQKAEMETLRNSPQTDETIQKQDQLTCEIAETTSELKNLTKEYENFGSVAAQKIAVAGDKVQEVGKKMSSAGSKLTMGITAPVVAGAAAAVSAYGDVDKQFQLVKQTMGDTANTAEDFEGLWDQIGNSAKNSVYGMQDAADATLNYARQGFTAKQATEMLTPAMSLAAGTGTDLSTVTAGLGNALKMFGADSSEAAGYADVLAAAQAQANTDTSQLFEAMSTAGPMCKTVGWNMKDLATITDVFGNAGISGSEGANALKTGLARLSDAQSTGISVVDEAVASLFDENGAMVSMTETQAKLHDAFSGLTDQEQLNAAATLFGKNQMSKWLTLIQASPDEVNGLRTALDDVSGSAEDMADALMSGTGGKIEQLKSTFDVLKVTVGETVAPALTKVMEVAINLMNAFTELDPATQKLIMTIAGIAAAIGPVLVVVGKLATGIGAVMKLAPAITGIIGTVGKLGSVFSSLWGVLAANPIVLVVAAVAALVAGFVHLWNTSEDFRNFWIGLWEGIKNAAQTAWEAISGFFTETWNEIVGTAKDIFNGLGDFFGGIWDGISSAAGTAWDGITGVLSGAWDAITETASEAFTGIGDFFSGVWDGISSVASTAWDGITSTLSGAWEEIKTAAGTVFSTLGETVNSAWDGVKSTAETAWEGISTTLSGAWESIKTNAGDAFETVRSTVSEKWESMKSDTSTAWDTIRSTVEEKGGGIEGVIGTAVEGYKKVWQSGFDFINEKTGGRLGDALQSAREKMGNIGSIFTDKMESIKKTVSDGLEKVKKFFSGCKLSLPKIKLPHFSITGSFSIKPPKVPHISVKWYKKAYENAVMFDSPTVLSTMSGLKGFGDGSGSEMVVGTNRLMNMIADASGQNELSQAMEGFMTQIISLMSQYFPQMANQQVVMDSGALVGSIAPQMNRQLGIIAGRKMRG